MITVKVAGIFVAQIIILPYAFFQGDGVPPFPTAGLSSSDDDA
ncbi:Uncharacterised protein [Serratia fonticola]|jgi:hypothetical protein|nr:Uncharacterised protein [Serratia fonticola]